MLRAAPKTDPPCARVPQASSPFHHHSYPQQSAPGPDRLLNATTWRHLIPAVTIPSGRHLRNHHHLGELPHCVCHDLKPTQKVEHLGLHRVYPTVDEHGYLFSKQRTQVTIRKRGSPPSVPRPNNLARQPNPSFVDLMQLCVEPKAAGLPSTGAKRIGLDDTCLNLNTRRVYVSNQIPPREMQRLEPLIGKDPLVLKQATGHPSQTDTSVAPTKKQHARNSLSNRALKDFIGLI